MPKFSDIPYFIIKDYINQINPINASKKLLPEVDNWESIKFCDYFDDQSFCGEKDYTTEEEDDSQGSLFEIGLGASYWNGWYQTDSDKDINTNPLIESNQHISYLRRPNDIIVNGGIFIDFFVKDVDYGFRPVRLIPLFNEPEEQIYFDFWDVEMKTTIKGSQIVKTLVGPQWICNDDSITCSPSGYTHQFNKYDTNSELVTDLSTLIGSEIYIRKDSPFYDWLKNSAYNFYLQKWEVEFNIRNFINTDKSFIYFGKIYPVSHKSFEINKPAYHIIFDGMKDFVKRIIPEHQRTTNLLKYLEIYFDRVYNEIYGLQKNIFTLKDPLEIDIKYLNLYLRKYSINYDIDVIDDFSFREFSRDIVYLLKSKSTYQSYKILWRLLSSTRNELDLYERWHDKNITDQVYESDYVDINYLDRYLSSTFDDDTENLVLSTAYKINMDLSLEPMTLDAIEPANISRNLTYLLELFRPINRVATYSYSISPIVDLTGDWVSLYVNYPDHLLSRNLSSNRFTESSWIHIQDELSNSWVVTHGLNSVTLLTQIIDIDGNELVPKKIEFIDNNNIVIDFEAEVQGVCLFRKANLAVSNITRGNDEKWIINHSYNTKEMLVQFKTLLNYTNIGNCTEEIVNYEEDDEKIYTGDIELDYNKIITDNIKSISIMSIPDVIYVENDEKEIWEINHNLNKRGLMVQCYDHNNIAYKPSEYIIPDNNNIELHFDYPFKGYAVIQDIGHYFFKKIFYEKINDYYDLEIRVGSVENSYLEEGIIYRKDINIINIEDGIFSIPFTIEKSDEEVNIREIGLFEKSTGDLLFYTKCYPIFKHKNFDIDINYRISEEPITR